MLRSYESRKCSVAGPAAVERRAFTLVELLVVVSIIAILVSILVPTLGRARVLAWRTACSVNVREIVRGCINYANSSRMHMGAGSAVGALPSTAPSSFAENAESLYLLIEHGFVPTRTFVCPQAQAKRFLNEPASTGGFTDATYSYSYLSQVTYNETMIAGAVENAPTDLILIADDNPGYVISSGSTGTGNSRNHEQEGQNIGRLDEATMWITEPDETGDNIYTGPRSSLQDSFVCP